MTAAQISQDLRASPRSNSARLPDPQGLPLQARPGRPRAEVIDFDEVRLGDPAYDVAHFCAHLRLLAAGSPATRPPTRTSKPRSWPPTPSRPVLTRPRSRGSPPTPASRSPSSCATRGVRPRPDGDEQRRQVAVMLAQGLAYRGAPAEPRAADVAYVVGSWPRRGQDVRYRRVLAMERLGLRLDSSPWPARTRTSPSRSWPRCGPRSPTWTAAPRVGDHLRAFAAAPLHYLRGLVRGQARRGRPGLPGVVPGGLLRPGRAAGRAAARGAGGKPGCTPTSPTTRPWSRCWSTGSPAALEASPPTPRTCGRCRSVPSPTGSPRPRSPSPAAGPGRSTCASWSSPSCRSRSACAPGSMGNSARPPPGGPDVRPGPPDRLDRAAGRQEGLRRPADRVPAAQGPPSGLPPGGLRRRPSAGAADRGDRAPRPHGGGSPHGRQAPATSCCPVLQGPTCSRSPRW